MYKCNCCLYYLLTKTVRHGKSGLQTCGCNHGKQLAQ